MSKAIIKSQLLKYCNVGFKLWLDGIQHSLRTKEIDRVTAWQFNCENDIYCSFPITKEVEVEKDEYQGAVVKYLRSIFDFEKFLLVRFKKDEDGVCLEFDHTNNGFYLISLPVKIDPRPWEEFYTIELKGAE